MTLPDGFDIQLAAQLRSAGLLAAEEPTIATALAGGVSSQIWKLESRNGPFCVKRALAKLNVADEWTAPISRNIYERDWYATMAQRCPTIAPRILGFGADNWFAMEYFPPASSPLWKTELLAGRVSGEFARLVGAALAASHRVTAGDPALRDHFATDSLFTQLRLDPYLLHASRLHADLAVQLEQLCRRSLATKLTLVHGDVSPKNILATPGGPVFLDAECAWYGDPAFDLAFCLNHLLLKRIAIPGAATALTAAFDSFAAAYFAGVDWEPPAQLEGRAATLLPALMLARVDGKSPVEYITAEADRSRVRQVAREGLLSPRHRVSKVRALWEEVINE